MQGLYHLPFGASLERVEQKSGSMALLAKFGDFEIMEQVVNKGKAFYIYPGEKENLFEFFYILEGVIYDENNELFMRAGEMFYVKDITEPVYFRAHTKVKLLYILNDSLFAYMSDRLKKLKIAVDKVEEKDAYTEQHGSRVMELAVLVAENMNRHVDVPELSYAALFHDLGKVDIPTAILQKPGKLTIEEYEVIKKHPALGRVIADDIKFLDIGEIIEQHHERIDGTGYPKGLKGEEICIEARIIAIVDCFDAMTSDRPYRKGLNKEVAIEELERFRGIHYDAEIVDVFIDIINNSVQNFSVI